uniref:Uncharacterized protein n=1 Tax=Acrobeloides nanus TaxID=290746 RepID=A0A914CK27_9BILA
MRPLFIRMNNGQYLDGQGLSADNTDNHETDKACPRTSRTTNGTDKACPRSRRTSSETDKACPRSRRTIMGRTRLVRGQDGHRVRRTRLVRGQDGQSWDGQGLSAVKTGNHGTDKACPRSRRTIMGRTRLVRGQ